MQHLGLRSSKVETTANQEVKCCHELAFATDEWKSPNDRRLWLKALRASCAFTTGGRRDQESSDSLINQVNEISGSVLMSCGLRLPYRLEGVARRNN
ncbi:hypothetical protein GQ600_17900 [Phytophthora cactorum]|nr:hypothetical protein GQ600_17900 [Phytophthora cactorum]